MQLQPQKGIVVALFAAALASGCADAPQAPAIEPHSTGPRAAMDVGPVTRVTVVFASSDVYVSQAAQDAQVFAFDAANNAVLLPFGHTITWSSTNPAAATVSATQYADHETVRSVGVGTTNICATVDAIQGCKQLVVHADVPPLSFTFSAPDTIPVAASYTWSMTNITGGDGSYTYEWWFYPYDNPQAGVQVGSGTTYSRWTHNQDGKFFIVARVRSAGMSATATDGVDASAALDASIGGPSKIFSEGLYTWDARPVGGAGNYTYQWSGDASGTGSTVQFYYDCSSPFTRHLTLTVTSGSYSYSTSVPVANMMSCH